MTLRPLFAIGLIAGLALPAASEEPGTGPRHAIAMHGEPALGPDFPYFPYVNPDAPKGGTLRQAAIGAFDSFNPFIIKGSPTGLPGLFETLMANSADEAFTEYGLLAESVETPKDRSWVEFTLRDGARWHDGVPVSVDDVIWTFNALVENGRPFYRFYYGGVENVERTGPRKVKFTFKPGDNLELPLILGQLVVLPKHWWESRDFTATLLEPPLGSGPYALKSFEVGRYVEMERVGDYWGADLPVNIGQNNFDIRRIDYYRDTQVAIEAFKAGAFDYRAENSSKAWATAYEIPARERGDLIAEEIPHERPAGMQGFVFNMRKPIFEDVAVREALAYAFDFEWSNETLFYGQYARTRSFFDNSEMAARDLPGEEELALLEPLRADLPPRVFETAYAPPSTADGSLRGNMRKAIELLKAAGWSLKDGVMTREADGLALSFEILLVSPLFERIALPFSENLKRIGVETRVRTVDTAQYRRRLDSFDFDMVVSTWGQSESPGNEQRNYWTSSAATREGSRNLAGLSNPAIDALVEQLIAAPDRDALIVRTRALDRALQWSFIVIPQWHTTYDRVAYWNVFGRPERNPRRGVSVATWWIDAEKAAALDRSN